MEPHILTGKVIMAVSLAEDKKAIKFDIDGGVYGQNVSKEVWKSLE